MAHAKTRNFVTSPDVQEMIDQMNAAAVAVCKEGGYQHHMTGGPYSFKSRVIRACIRLAAPRVIAGLEAEGIEFLLSEGEAGLYTRLPPPAGSPTLS